MTVITTGIVRDMALTHFHLTTHWSLPATPIAVRDALARPQYQSATSQRQPRAGNRTH
jgi:hypothetical protein